MGLIETSEKADPPGPDNLRIVPEAEPPVNEAGAARGFPTGYPTP